MTQVSSTVGLTTTVMILRRGQKADAREVEIVRRGTKEIVCRNVVSGNAILVISPSNKDDNLVYQRSLGPTGVVIEEKNMDVSILTGAFFYEEFGCILLVIG